MSRSLIPYVILLLIVPLYYASTENSLSNSKHSCDNIWKVSFDSKELTAWSYVLHPQGVNVLPTPNEQGNTSAYIEIRGDSDYLWRSNKKLNRVELQHKPNSTKTGDTTIVRWRFMLPELFSDDVHQIAYWESEQSYQQSFRLQLTGQRLSLISSPNNQEMWHMSGINTKHWYSIALQVIWSTTKGHVRLSIDNQSPVDLIMPTLVAENENMFFQLGILRPQMEKIEAIWLDDVIVHNIVFDH